MILLRSLQCVKIDKEELNFQYNDQTYLTTRDSNFIAKKLNAATCTIGTHM